LGLRKITKPFAFASANTLTADYFFIGTDCLKLWRLIHYYIFDSPFWATVSKTVHPMLSDRCLSCLSVLSVTFVHCGQTVGRIKMKLSKQVGLGPGHIVLDGNPAPLPKRGRSPSNFRPMFTVAKRLDGSIWYLAWT